MPKDTTVHRSHHAAFARASADTAGPLPVAGTALATAVPALPRPKVLGPADHALHELARQAFAHREPTPREPTRREAGRELAARIWRRATAGHTVAIAEQLGLSHPHISRIGSGEKPLYLGDVLAIDPQIAARVLLAALEHVEAQPVDGEGLPLGEGLLVARTLVEVLVQLERAPIESMSLADRHQLADLIERGIEKLRRIVRRLRGVL